MREIERKLLSYQRIEDKNSVCSECAVMMFNQPLKMHPSRGMKEEDVEKPTVWNV